MTKKKKKSTLSRILSAFNITRAETRLADLEERLELVYTIADYNQKIVIELARAVADLSADQALLVSYFKSDKLDASGTSSSMGILNPNTDDDDFLN